MLILDLEKTVNEETKKSIEYSEWFFIILGILIFLFSDIILNLPREITGILVIMGVITHRLNRTNKRQSILIALLAKKIEEMQGK